MKSRRRTQTSSYRQVSAKQLNKMITTYRKNNKYIFKDIMMMAEAQGIKLKSGSLENEKWVSSSKRKTKQVQKLYEQIVNQYGGSYTQYEKGLRKRYSEYKKELEPGVEPISFNRYDLFIESRKDLANEIYSIAYSLDKENGTRENVEEAATIYDYATDNIKEGKENQALFDLLNHLKKLQNQADKYNIDYDTNIYSKIKF